MNSIVSLPIIGATQVSAPGIAAEMPRNDRSMTNLADEVVLSTSAGISDAEPIESDDPAFGLIRAKRQADVLYSWAIEAKDVAEQRYGIRSEEAWEAAERCEAAYHATNEIGWKLATTQPTTLAGVVSVLGLANLIEDEGCEWPDTNTIGPDGWHYQLRATMAAAIETIVRRGA
ncbi:hypothetical protein [Bradyrhizobium sp. STM 3561]|uniref:hypothetical protein n=1 Tax=Bradyrhizobium sp. STM 3561 TaxID=578923 RepID=UPI00388F9A4C